MKEIIESLRNPEKEKIKISTLPLLNIHIEIMSTKIVFSRCIWKSEMLNKTISN